MALSYDLSKIENFETLCHDTMTEAEAEEAGTTFEKLLKETTFFGPRWSELEGISELEVLSGKERKLVRMSMVTHSLIFATISIGIGEIAEDTEVEFYARLALMRKVRGPMLHVTGENGEAVPRPITIDEVRAHRGLTTNAGGPQSWSSWARNMLDMGRERLMREAGVEDIALPQNELQVHEIIDEVAESLVTLGHALEQADFDSPELGGRADRLAERHHEQLRRYMRGLEDMNEKWTDLAERDQEYLDSSEEGEE